MTPDPADPTADPSAPAGQDPFGAWQPLARPARRRHVAWSLAMVLLAGALGFGIVRFGRKHGDAASGAAAIVVALSLVNVVRTVVWSRNFRFRLTASTVETLSRFVVTRVRYVPLGRVQHVDVSSGPIEQSLGIANVVAHTAAGDATIAIPGVAADVAAALRDRLLAERRLEAT